MWLVFHPPDIIHVISVSSPFFAPLLLPCITLNANRKAKKKCERPGNEARSSPYLLSWITANKKHKAEKAWKWDQRIFMLEQINFYLLHEVLLLWGIIVYSWERKAVDCYVTIYRSPSFNALCSSPSSCWNDNHLMKMRYVWMWFCPCFSLQSKPMWGCILWLRWLLLQSACDEVLTATGALLPPQGASQGNRSCVCRIVARSGK